jgi:cytochrome P450 / NADPH-cytochrome P450 reductase
MFAAGTGLAPFRGFLQQRAAILATNTTQRPLAPAVLFLGCRSATRDRLYADEIDAWMAAGVVDVRYAFSAEPELSKGCRYVPERMERDAEVVKKLWRQGARVYVCGSRRFALGVRAAAEGIARAVVAAEGGNENGNENENANGMELKEEEMKARFEAALVERVASDVFD